MKRLFLFAALMFAAVATSCDPNNSNNEEFDDGSVKMHIVSEDYLIFNYLGGEHSSYYTIKNVPQDSVIVAQAPDKWVNSFVTKNIGEVRYVIDPNDSGVERETTLTVSCKDAFVDYTIKQQAADVTCKASYASCNYYGALNSDNANFQLTISLHNPNNVNGGNIVYSLDLYRKGVLQPGDPMAIPLGNYVLDPINNGENDVIYKKGSACTMIDGTNLTFAVATLRVEKNRLVFYGKTTDERWHLATFYGDYEFVDMAHQ